VLGVKIHRVLAGTDGPGRRALPLGEFLHPLPLFALVALVVNDHLLKGAGILPAAVTGKLSDFAGLLFFPLLCTAATDLLLLGAARLGAPVDFSLRPYKLAIATLASAGLFALIKLSESGARTVADLLAAVGFPSQIVADPTDLFALPALALAYWLGLREIARIPLGRLEVLERAWCKKRTPIAPGLRDVERAYRRTRRGPAGGAAGEEAAATATADVAAAFEGYLQTGDAAAAEAALSFFRAPRGARSGHP